MGSVEMLDASGDDQSATPTTGASSSGGASPWGSADKSSSSSLLSDATAFQVRSSRHAAQPWLPVKSAKRVLLTSRHRAAFSALSSGTIVVSIVLRDQVHIVLFCTGQACLDHRCIQGCGSGLSMTLCNDSQDDASAQQRWQPPGARPSGLAGRGAPAQDVAVTAAGPRAVAPPGGSSEAQRSDGTPRRPVVELSMKIAGMATIITIQLLKARCCLTA